MPQFQSAFKEMSRRRPFSLARAGSSAWRITLRDGGEITHTGSRLQAECFARAYVRLAGRSLSESDRLDLAEELGQEIFEAEQERLSTLLYARA